ncbi:hypothetical protein O3Q51_11100 [Cryomorphaceae bacterium 1068]|nr:hypothetical protein [Cryomorphaceae bacterium 1068]
MLRKILNVLILGGLVAIAFYWFYRDFEKPLADDFDTLSAIPQTAAVIFESQDLTEVWRDLSSKSLVWSELQATDYFFRLNDLGQILDSLIRSDSKLRGLLASKPIAVSAHMTGGQEYGFLFAMQLDLDIAQNEVHKALESTFRTTEFESRVYDGENVNSFLSPFFDGRMFYFIKNELLVFSLSEVLAEESVRTLVQNASVLGQKQFNAVRETIDDGARAHLYLNYEQFKPIISQYASSQSQQVDFFNQPFADWSALDFSIENDAIYLNGFVVASDSSRAWLDAFSSQEPPRIELFKFLPSNTAYFAFLGYGDYSAYRIEKRKKLEKNGSLFKHDSSIQKFNTACNCDAENLGASWIEGQAIAFITEPSSKEYDQNMFAIFEPNDSESAEEMLKEFATAMDDLEESEFEKKKYFRLPVGDFYGTAVGSAFGGLVDPYVVRLEDAIVMANSENAIRNYLSTIQSGRSFLETEEYDDLREHLFTDAHFILYSSLAKSPSIFGNILDEKFAGNIESQTEVLRNFKSFAYQISHSTGDLFYNNIYLKQGSDYKKETGTLWEVKLKAEVKGKTHLVKNHYTGVLETVVQDMNNRIYLISSNGKVVWETTLDGPIQGSIKQVDVYKNKKLQMLFNTPNRVYLLDRNGNAVESFPVELKSPATAEVSVADYDNSRDYRIFIPTETERILCFDSYGKTVEGWNYTGGSGEAILPVEHLRIKRKDYLFTLTQGGDILLLNRKGEPRHKVSQKAEGFVMGGYKLDIGSKITNSSLYFADSLGTAFRLGFGDSLEKLQPRPQNSSSYFFAKVDVDEFMDFGFLYNQSFAAFSFQGDILFDTDLPQSNFDQMAIHRSGRSNFFSVLNSLQNQVYLFDENGQAIPGFPVFGSTIPSVGDINLDGFANMVTTGKDGYVYAYSIEQD